VLTVANLAFGFRNRDLFSNLSFSLTSGQLTHLSGANGSGKSTLLAIIAGLIAQDAGTIVAGDSSHDRRHILEFLAAESGGHFLHMNAQQNLSFWAHLRGLTPTTAELHTALAHWSLNQPFVREQLAVGRFSTGMKRRLALARFSLTTAKLWVMDEPLLGLDRNACQAFHAALQAHLSKGGAAIIASHELEPIAALVNHTLAMEDFQKAVRHA